MRAFYLAVSGSGSEDDEAAPFQTGQDALLARWTTTVTGPVLPSG